MKKWSSRYLAAFLLVLVALAQVAVPVSMILRREATLRHGVLYRFRTRPVDPYDAFRGRYVALSFAADAVSVEDASEFRPRRRVHVLLENDAEGFARFAGASLSRPPSGDWIATHVNYVHGGSNVSVRVPFNRFYMNEREAPAAEAAYNAARRDGGREAYATVRVRGGMAVLEDLFIEGVPIREYLKRKHAAEGSKPTTRQTGN